MTHVTVKVPDSLKARIIRQARREGRNTSGLVRIAVLEYLDRAAKNGHKVEPAVPAPASPEPTSP